MNKLSVIIPIYNGAGSIKKCVNSVLQQTYQHLELILIDDGSHDDSYKIVKEFIEKNNKNKIEIKLMKEEKNKGVAYIRNQGVLAASGEYITFIDQDDYILPEYCDNYMREACKYNADIIIGGYKRITKGRVTGKVLLSDTDWAKFIVTAPWAHVYKTEFLIQNNIQFLSTGIGEDIYFNVTAYSYTNKIKIIPEQSYMWVNNPVSVSNSKQRSINKSIDPVYFMDALIKRMPKENYISKEYQEYFFMRYIVWYFTFTLCKSKKEDVVYMYKKMINWLEKNFPNYMKNSNISMNRPKGDPFLNRFIVWAFYFLKKWRILLPCLKLLAK